MGLHSFALDYCLTKHMQLHASLLLFAYFIRYEPVNYFIIGLS